MTIPYGIYNMELYSSAAVVNICSANKTTKLKDSKKKVQSGQDIEYVLIQSKVHDLWANFPPGLRKRVR